MRASFSSLPLLTLLLGTIGIQQCRAESMIFKGSMVLIYPSLESNQSSADRHDTINFYCYAHGMDGYLSFGWYLGGEPQDVDTSRCVPNSTDYDWYEYARPETGMTCTEDMLRCQTHSIGWYVGKNGEPDAPMVDDDYQIMSYLLGRPEEALHASYYDKAGGMHAVGVRRMVEPDECAQAFETIKELRDAKNPPLTFDLENPCAPAETMQLQRPQSFTSKLLSKIGFGEL